MRVRTLLVVLVPFAVLAAVSPARADTISFGKEFKLNGWDNADYRYPAVPTDTPQVTMTEFTEGGKTGVYLTMDLRGMSDPDNWDSYDKYYVRNWLFNFNPNKNLDDLSFEWDSQVNGAPRDYEVTVQKARDSFGLRGEIGDSSDDWSGRSGLYDVTGLADKYNYSELGGHASAVPEDALGKFDIMFSFPFPDSGTAYELDLGESITYKITSSSGSISVADFKFPSLGGGKMSAVDLWPECENYEVWYGSPAPAGVVPEPGTLVLLGTGLLGVGTWARRRRGGSPESREG